MKLMNRNKKEYIIRNKDFLNDSSALFIILSSTKLHDMSFGIKRMTQSSLFRLTRVKVLLLEKPTTFTPSLNGIQ